jgi:formate dehydrogenase subunit delta
VSGDLPPVIRLGHDLVRNFEALPPGKAAAEMATHIRKFWDPRMRRELLRYVDAGDARVDPLLAAAAAGLREGRVDQAEVREPSGG